MKDWNDLQFLMALARFGNLPAAAEALDVNRTTVARRIDNLEAALGVAVVERVGRDLVLTSAGREVLATAELIDGEVGHLERQVYGRDQALSGVIRVTLTEGIGCLIAPCLATFQQQHPDVLLELSVTNKSEDLDLMESDVALRFTTNPPEHLVGRRIGQPRVAMYTSAVSRAGEKAPRNFIQSYVYDQQSQTTDDQALNPVFRVNSMAVIRELVAAGVGVAELPCYIAEGDKRLKRISEPRADHLPEIWVFYHPRLRSQLRIRKFVDFIVGVFEELQPVLEAA